MTKNDKPEQELQTITRTTTTTLHIIEQDLQKPEQEPQTWTVDNLCYQGTRIFQY